MNIQNINIKLNKASSFKLKNNYLFVSFETTGDPVWHKVLNWRQSENIGDEGGLPKLLTNPQTRDSDNGLKISLSGRLRGVRMARKLVEHQGVGLRTQSIEWAVEEEKRQIFTKWGTIGIKVNRGGAKER